MELMQQAREHYEAGRIRQAQTICRRILAGNPNHADALCLVGVIAHQTGKINEAIKAYNDSLAFRSDFKVLYNLGSALHDAGKLNEAASAYRRSLELNGNNADTYNNLGIVLKEQGRLDEAIASFQRALAINADSAEAYYNLGNAFRDQERLDHAIDAYHKSIALRPAFDAYNNLGNIFKNQGRLEEARKAYRNSLQLNPTCAEAYESVVSITAYNSIDHPDIAAIRSLLKRPNLPERDTSRLYYALGKIHDDCAVYDEAFACYREGNRIRHKQSRFNPKHFSAYIDRTIGAFRQDFFARHQLQGSDSQMPVFIVGMPRSGKTLVEQNISSHPQVHGVGELDKIPELASGLPAYPEGIIAMDQDVTVRLFTAYEGRLRLNVKSGVLRVTDTMPANFLHLGLIALLFPNARIIHCQRHPLDVCLSIYFHDFHTGNDYAYDLSDIGTYYCQYKRLMEHWRDVLPLRMYEIEYEELVADQETKTKELIDFLNLRWDQRCLRHERNQRPLRTTEWAVRQPIDSKSVNRWRNYEKHLAALQQMLT